jgi:chromosome partitioning protein
MIIALASLKGGSGKTTLSVHLAAAISQAGRKVLLADADPQGSASDWAAAREDTPPFPVVGMARNTIHRDLPAIASDYHHTVIDTPPRVSALARAALLAADVVLIPCQPSSYDIWAASETVTLIDEARGFKPDLLGAFVINRKIPNTLIGRDVVDALGEYDLPLLDTALAQRVAYAESAAGYSVLETAPTSAAAEEVKSLAKDVLKLAGVKKW